MREPTIYISTDGSVPSQRYAIDDPAIVEALAIAQAARAAGLVEDGKLIGHCWRIAAGGQQVFVADDWVDAVEGELVFIATPTHSAAEAAKGGGE